MVGPWVFYQEIVEVVGDVVTITWSKGINQTEITSTTSAFFVGSPNVDIMDIDSNDEVFSTNSDMIISSLPLTSATQSSSIELGYGPTNGSTSGWTKLFTATITAGQTIDIPRRIFLPKGNFITVDKTGGSGNLKFTGTISIQQTVPLDSDINNDMEGNSP